jgi:PAS domain-containing protein
MTAAHGDAHSDDSDLDFDPSQDERVVDDYFALMGRDGIEQLEHAAQVLKGVPLLQDTIDAMPLPVALLNDKGQVVLVNRRWTETLGEEGDCVLGKRHGELLGCIHAAEGSDGCGTASQCAECGGLVSIMESRQLQGQVVRDYRLQRRSAQGIESAEFIATVTPIQVDGRPFMIFVLQDRVPREASAGAFAGD